MHNVYVSSTAYHIKDTGIKPERLQYSRRLSVVGVVA